ncbi:DUF2141 domain-containing protein [Altererythrobacter sp. CAU 1778]
MIGGAAPVADAARLTVTVSELRSSDGLVRACLTPDPGDFPNCKHQPANHQLTVRAADKVTLVFKGIEPGRYAVALLHDENGNGKVDRALVLPKEGFGFSRDAKLQMGPPRFDAAAIDLKSGQNRQTIRMRYIL